MGGGFVLYHGFKLAVDNLIKVTSPPTPPASEKSVEKDSGGFVVLGVQAMKLTLENLIKATS